MHHYIRRPGQADSREDQCPVELVPKQTVPASPTFLLSEIDGVSESVRGLRVHCECLAAVEDLFVLVAIVVGEAIGVTGQRAGNLPDSGRDRHRRWRGGGTAAGTRRTVLSLPR